MTSASSTMTIPIANGSVKIMRALSISPSGSCEVRPPPRFRARHAAAVGLVVHAQQVEHAMQHQNPQFRFDGMAVLRGLRGRALPGDSQFARAWLAGRRLGGGKRKHIGGSSLPRNSRFSRRNSRSLVIRHSNSRPVGHFVAQRRSANRSQRAARHDPPGPGGTDTSTTWEGQTWHALRPSAVPARA